MNKFIPIKREQFEGNVKYYGTEKEVLVPLEYKELDEELRGVWVSTVGNIDIPRNVGEEKLKEYLISILEKLKEYHMNTAVFQVRPTSDALYKTDKNPWSDVLTGVQGKDPGFDVLEFFVNEAKKRNISVHAWINPYRVSGVKLDDLRVTKDEYLETLAPNNFARLRKDLVILTRDSKMIFDPASTEVMEFVSDTVLEIAKNYDVKAVHIDDYFYPYDPIRDPFEYDKMKKAGFNDVSDFRRDNVNRMIELIHNKLETLDKKVEFGISPFGIYRTNIEFAGEETGEQLWEKGSNNHANCCTNYKDLYADIYVWMKNGWIDYVMPQNYFDFDNTTLDKDGNEVCRVRYADLAVWWSNICKETNTKLYMGQAMYRYGRDCNWVNPDEIPNQLKFNQTLGNVKGTCFFTYRDFVSERNPVLVEGRNRLKSLWTKEIKDI